MRIAFYSSVICVRGSSVALYDYAHYNETILGNESIILVPESGLKDSDPVGMRKFVGRFRVISFADLEKTLETEKCDVLYCIKFGTKDGIVSTRIKTVVHCVFDMSEPHGDVYAGVSLALARKFGKNLFVPHMIGLRPSLTGKNLREKLGIPKDAVVFGRYGGEDTFRLDFCQRAISRIVNEDRNIYFAFINTPRFINHPKVFYLDKITEEDDKNLFICTCDAHLECGDLGHSFGLAIGEFSVNNKPAIVYRPEPAHLLWNTAHLDILGEKGIYYKNEEEFYTILTTFKPEDYRFRDMNCYGDYTPEKVMKVFEKVFLR